MHRDRNEGQQIASSRIGRPKQRPKHQSIMPRPYLPLLISRPNVDDAFHLDASAKRYIGRALDLKELPGRTIESIDRAVNCYRATASGSRSTTVANTLLALRNLEGRRRARKESLALLADDRAAVDYTTINILQPLAKAVLAGQPGANEALRQAAQSRTEELTPHPRVLTSVEPMRLFCGVLRLIFNESAAHLKGRITDEEAWHRCRRFATELFTAAGIDHADFDAHPERLTEYLGTDVSID
jgi:hypothetical protein